MLRDSRRVFCQLWYLVHRYQSFKLINVKVLIGSSDRHSDVTKKAVMCGNSLKYATSQPFSALY